MAAPRNFAKYALCYDLLYRDKDYAAEAGYVGRLIRSAMPAARSLLEFGCGTGRHARLLCAMGFDVHGVDHSPEMVAIANASMPVAAAGSGVFTSQVGDICKAHVGRCFDAVLALFHVVSYQTTQDALRATFAAAAAHLAPGGVFIFDVWHGPAVLHQKPEARTREASDARHLVRRTARPVLDAPSKTVEVTYDMECRDTASGEVERFSEQHVMRYLFPQEVEVLAANAGLRVVRTEEFLTGAVPSPATWSVLYVLQQ
jgi:SAM-dependent methyltransferase